MIPVTLNISTAAEITKNINNYPFSGEFNAGFYPHDRMIPVTVNISTATETTKNINDYPFSGGFNAGFYPYAWF